MPEPRCPICKKPLLMTPAGRRTPTHPFCSVRCKTIDLGNWLGDRYVIAGPALDEEQLDDEALAALLREPS